MLINKLTQLTIFIVFSILFTVTVSAATFTVDSTGDEVDLSPGNGICATSLGTCTLRAAIQEANALAGADNIHFNIPTSDTGYRDYDTPNTASSGDSSGGDDYWTIRIATLLPAMTEETHIDGSTQESLSGVNRNTSGPDIEIRHTTAFPGGIFTFSSGAVSSLVNGLVINNFGTSGANGGIASSAAGLVITRMYIGTDVKGLVDATLSGVAGIIISGNLNNIIGEDINNGNVISGVRVAIALISCVSDETSRNYIRGNIIGLGSDGETLIGNSNEGISVTANCRVEIGGESNLHRNYISVC